MARACTVCTHPEHQSIDRDLLSGTPYRAVGKRYGVGTSAVFRHRRDHLTELMAKAVEAREIRGLERHVSVIWSSLVGNMALLVTWSGRRGAWLGDFDGTGRQ